MVEAFVPRDLAGVVCEQCEAEALARRRAEERQRRLASRRGGAGLPLAYHGLSLSELGSQGWPGDVVMAAHTWTVQGGGLYLFGPNGTGKTTLAAAAAWAALQRFELRWIRAAQLARWALADYDSDEFKAADRLVESSTALILDDLGQEIAAGAAANKIKEAIEHRVENGLPLLITSNYRVSQLAARESYGQWLASRVAGYCRQYELAGRDHRLDWRHESL